MKKIKLSINELKVESFATISAQKPKGTVKMQISGYDNTICISEIPDPNCTIYQECRDTMGIITCAGTCKNTCNETCNITCNGNYTCIHSCPHTPECYISDDNNTECNDCRL